MMGQSRKLIQSSPIEMKGRVYASCVRSSMTYGSETRSLLVDVGLKFERAEMQMIIWMCGISLKDRRTNEKFFSKHAHATRVQNTTFYSDGTTHTKQHRSKRVQPNGSPCVNNHCSTRYEQSFRHNKHTHTNQKAATDKHSRHNH